MIAVLQRLQSTHVKYSAAEAPPANVRSDVPSADWTEQELLDRAKWEYERLKRHRFAPVYWSLGNVLKVVSEALDERQWSAWRKRHEIDRTKAYRALLFVRAFKSLEELGDLSIRKAERLAKRRLGQPEPPSDEERRVRRRLARLLKQTLPEVLADLAAVEAAERLQPMIDQLGEAFGEIYDLAQQKIRDETKAVGNLRM